MISPYYQEENITIYNGDCLEVMKELPDKSIDLVLTDPPYGVDLKYSDYVDTESNWFDLFESIIPEFKRIADVSILPSCQIKRLEYIYKTFPPDWLICWYKGSAGTSGFLGFNDWEPLLVYGKKKIYMHDYLAINNNEKMGSYGHPCPKPIGWAKWFISRVTNEGDTILDPFLGSGTTARACKDLGRKCIGIEISQKYCDIAVKRLGQEVFNFAEVNQ